MGVQPKKIVPLEKDADESEDSESESGIIGMVQDNAAMVGAGVAATGVLGGAAYLAMRSPAPVNAVAGGVHKVMNAVAPGSVSMATINQTSEFVGSTPRVYLGAIKSGVLGAGSWVGRVIIWLLNLVPGVKIEDSSHIQTAIGTALLAGVMINPTSYDVLNTNYEQLVGWSDTKLWDGDEDTSLWIKARIYALYVPFWIITRPLWFCNWVTGKIWNTTTTSVSSALKMDTLGASIKVNKEHRVAILAILRNRFPRTSGSPNNDGYASMNGYGTNSSRSRDLHGDHQRVQDFINACNEDGKFSNPDNFKEFIDFKRGKKGVYDMQLKAQPDAKEE